MRLFKLKLLNERADTFLFMAVLTLVYISICIETDMYVPAFPQMVKDLGTTEDQIQGVLGANFLGLCLSSLWVGPLADSFGRRRIILLGLTLFVIASLGCVWSDTLPTLMIWRLIQGLGAGAPMTAAFAIQMDRFDSKTAASMIGFMNTVITLSMAGAPIVGAWVTYHFHWKMNFIIISILGILAWLSFYWAIPETLPLHNRPPFKTKRVLRDFARALTSLQFLAPTLVCTLVFAGIVVFVSNQSLIFLNYLNVPREVYGYYQASSMTFFAIGSLLSNRFIRRFRIIGAKRTCIALVALGGTSLIGTAFFVPQSPFLICFSTAVINLGGGIGIGSIAASAMEVFPNMKATASGVMGFLRLILTSAMVALSSHFFTGSILPVALIVGGAQGLACIFYWQAHRSRKDRSYVPVESEPLPLIH